MPCPGAHLCDGSAPHVPESGTTGAFYPLFRSPRPINRDVRRTCDLPRAPEAKNPNFGAGVRFFNTPETDKPFYRALRGTSPVSGVRPRCAPASKMEETAPGVRPRIAPSHKKAKTVAVGVGGYGGGAQMPVSQRFKCFNGAAQGAVERFLSLIFNQLRTTTQWGSLLWGGGLEIRPDMCTFVAACRVQAKGC